MFSLLVLETRGMRPSTNVSQVQMLDAASHMGWVCWWFLSLLQEFFASFCGFPPTTKATIQKFQFHLEAVNNEPPLGTTGATVKSY